MEKIERVKYEAIIIGAGPAGTACGYLLASRGVKCVVVDRAVFPRDKICGGGLSPRCHRLLHEIFPDLRYEYNPVNRIKLYINGRLRLDFETDEPLRITQRKLFDKQLLDEYLRIGGEFVNDALTDIQETADGIVATLKSGRQLTGRYLVGADGANSRVRKYLAGPQEAKVLCVEKYMPRTDENVVVGCLSNDYGIGYAYVFPNLEHNVVGYGNMDASKVNLDHVIEGMEKAGVKLSKSEARLKGAFIPMDSNYPLHDRILLIGDAGGFPQRVTCEGIYFVLLTARNAARAILEGIPFRETNAVVFAKKKKEERAVGFFYSRMGLWLLSMGCRWFPGLIARTYNKHV